MESQQESSLDFASSLVFCLGRVWCSEKNLHRIELGRKEDESRVSAGATLVNFVDLLADHGLGPRGLLW